MARCPFATWIGSPNFGYGRGTHGQNRPIAIVDHVMQGYLTGCDGWFNNPKSWASAHFGIGKLGAIHQYVDTDDGPYANGAVNKPDAVGKALAALGNPNVLTISIEHEGFSGEEWTEDMYQADLKLKRWLLDTHLSLVPLQLMGHYQLDSVDRRNCPGPTWPRDRLLAELEDDMKPEAIRFAGSDRVYWNLPDKLVHIFAASDLEGVTIKDLAADDPLRAKPTLFPDACPAAP